MDRTPAREKQRYKQRPLMYSDMFARATVIANENGYALAMHGSLVRDGDFLAMPWTDEAIDREVLIELIVDDLNGCIHSFEDKPHGRKAWTILFTSRADQLDISIAAQLTAANDRIAELEAALKNASERISEIAFDIPAPNGYTPRLVQLSVAIAAAAAKAISEEPSK